MLAAAARALPTNLVYSAVQSCEESICAAANFLIVLATTTGCTVSKPDGPGIGSENRLKNLLKEYIFYPLGFLIV